MPVDPEKRDKFRQWVVDQGKTGGHASAAYTGEDTWLTESPAGIPFVSPVMTWATTGGPKIGHISRWYGPDGSGKSMSNWGMIYCAQNYPRIITEMYEREIRYLQARRKKFKAIGLGKKLKELVGRFPDGMAVCLYDTEQRAQLDIAAGMGVNLGKDQFLLVEENIIEEIAHQMTQAVEAYHVIIIDSASNAESYKEANLDPGSYEQGGAAAAWKRLRAVRRKLDRKENTIVIVDQMRMGLGNSSKYQKPTPQPPQIRFLKHNVSLAVEFAEGRKLFMNKDGTLTDDRDKASDDFRAMGVDWAEVAGLQMQFQVQKNSTGKPFRTGITRFKFPMHDARTGELVQEVGFDHAYEVLKAAEHFHILESGGSGMYYLLDEEFKRVPKAKGKGDFGWRGEWNAAIAIQEDEELRERVLTKLAVTMA